MSKTTKKQMDETATLFMTDFPKQLKADFKAACAERQITMKEAFKTMMEDFIRAKPAIGR